MEPVAEVGIFVVGCIFVSTCMFLWAEPKETNGPIRIGKNHFATILPNDWMKSLRKGGTKKYKK